MTGLYYSSKILHILQRQAVKPKFWINLGKIKTDYIFVRNLPPRRADTI